MDDIKFVLKCVAITAVLVFLMQIRIGSHTAEGHLMAWVHRSAISHTLQDVAEGAVKVTKQSSNAVSGFIKSQRSSDDDVTAPTQASSAGSGGWLKIKRSAAYYRQKEREKQERHAQQSDDSELNGADEADRD